METTVNSEPVPETTGNTAVRWDDTSPVTNGELAAMKLLLDRMEKAFADLQHQFDAEVAQAVAAERDRIRQMAVRTQAACYSDEGTGHWFADLLEPEGGGNG